jgi:HD-like signal output (HDOD) protein
MREVVGVVDSLPSIPATFAELERALASTSAPLPTISAIVERDTALSAKLLQLVNSSFFGRPRRVTRVDQAASLLGVQVLRSLVLSHEIANSAAMRGASAALSLENEQAHALLVAGIARRLAPAGPAADAAFVAGMLHDAGKLVLASKLPEAYRERVAEAGARGVPTFVAELERCGASHAEVGAYLLGLWGLPQAVIAATARHHRPSQSTHQGFTVLTAVHAANVIAHRIERQRNPDRPVEPPVDEYLEGLGLGGRLGSWEQLCSALEAPHV